MRFLRLIAVCLLALASLPRVAIVSAEIAFVDVNVIPMTDDVVREHWNVVIRDGVIVAAGPENEVGVPEGATRIEASGRFLIPGLADLHVHLHDPGDLMLYLASGVTTIANLGGDPSSLDLRDAIEAGTVEGPRLYTCGPVILGVEGAGAARNLVDRQKADGYDCVKIYDAISREAYVALADEAREQRIRTVGHIPRNLLWQDMLDAKPGSVAHAEEFLYSPIGEGDVAIIGNGLREAGISVVTTLVTYDRIGRQVADIRRELDRGENRFAAPIDRRAWAPSRNTYLHRFNEDRVPRLRQLLEVQKAIVGRLHQAGVRVLLGTDAGGAPFVVPGSSALEELRNLVDAGLTNFEALRAATSDAARELGAFDRRGTIEVGKSADLVLLLGNPLDDIADMDLQAGTMIAGQWMSRDELRRRIEVLAARRAREKELLDTFDVDVEEAVRRIDAMRERDESVELGEYTLNELGYQLWKIEDRLDDATRVFDLAVHLRPGAWVVWDSLADAYAEAGRTAEAIVALEKALSLEPRDRDGAERLARLREDDDGERNPERRE